MFCMRLPHITDLSKDVDVAIVGVPSDFNVSGGQGWAANQMRIIRTIDTANKGYDRHVSIDYIKELNIVDYYMRRGAYIAASNRARYVLENFPQTEVTDEALLVSIEANYKLGLIEEANNTLRVLALNYPQHDAFDEAGNLVLAERIRNRDRSWTNIMTLGLLDRPEVPPPIKIQQPDG